MLNNQMENLSRKKRRNGLAGVSKAVKERWTRRIRRKWAWAIARHWTRWRLPRLERLNRKVSLETFETMRYYATKNEAGKMKGVSTLFNMGLYLMIAHRDIQALKIDALTHSDEWTRKLNARIILLTIYEWDADRVAGRALQEAMDLMLIPDDLRQDMNAALRRLRKVKEKAEKEFSIIRNTAIAHRDPNALVQYRAIRDLDVNKVWAVAAEFFAQTEQFIGVQARILSATLRSPTSASGLQDTKIKNKEQVQGYHDPICS